MDEYAFLSPDEAKMKADGREPHFIPRPDETEEDAALNCAEGEALLHMIKECAGKTAIIAEDLGVVPKYVPPLLRSSAFRDFPSRIFWSIRDTRIYPQGRDAGVEHRDVGHARPCAAGHVVPGIDPPLARAEWS